MAAKYDFDLSRSELNWLAKSYGVTGLPLPDKAWDERPVQDHEADLKEGEASLLTRGLIRKSTDTVWQVDRLPSAIIQWLDNADFLLRVEHIPKKGPIRVAHVLTAGEQGLSVETGTDAAHFTLFETHQVLINSLLKWLAVLTSTKKDSAGFALPQPGAFLPAAWATPNLSEKMLRIAGISTQVQETTKWVQLLEYGIVLSMVELDGLKNTIIDQYCLCGDNKLVWGGWVEKEKVSFVSVSSKEMTAAIRKMLKRTGRQS